MKTRWVGILIILAIILTSASFILRIIYGTQLLEWEHNLIESWGINRLLYDFTKAVGFIGVLTCLLVRQRRRQKKQNAGYYELPKIRTAIHKYCVKQETEQHCVNEAIDTAYGVCKNSPIDADAIRKDSNESGRITNPNN
jgi:hypothetical protein